MTRLFLFASLLVSVPTFADEKPKQLKYEKKIEMPATEVHQIIFDSPLVEKATVTVNSPGTPINVHFVLESNRKAALTAIDDGKAPKDVLGGSEQVKEKVFEIGPGKKEFTIILWGARKDCDVKVSVTGK
jgi:hypothetical protein